MIASISPSSWVLSNLKWVNMYKVLKGKCLTHCKCYGTDKFKNSCQGKSLCFDIHFHPFQTHSINGINIKIIWNIYNQ